MNIMEETITKINSKVKMGEGISPFLFVGKNLELTNAKTKDLALDILKEHGVPKAYLYILSDTWDSLKVKDIKDFIAMSISKSPYWIQIFLIEDIWRLTLAASNSLLKFLEEPWSQNIVFLTNKSESNILDTILSRVQVVNFQFDNSNKESSFYQWLIESYINWSSNEIIAYFYKEKLEKEEYLVFLENLIIYIRKNFCLINFLDEINDDINLIKQNNLNPRFIADKWLIKIKLEEHLHLSS